MTEDDVEVGWVAIRVRGGAGRRTGIHRKSDLERYRPRSKIYEARVVLIYEKKTYFFPMN